MTPLESGTCLGEVPDARLTPPMASNAMNAPTAAAPPFSTLRRVAPSLAIYWCVLFLARLRMITAPSTTTHSAARPASAMRYGLIDNGRVPDSVAGVFTGAAATGTGVLNAGDRSVWLDSVFSAA